MKFRNTIILSVVLSLLGVIVASFSINGLFQGDILFFLGIYGIPLLFLILGNSIVLRFTIYKTDILKLRVGIGLIPLGVLYSFFKSDFLPANFIGISGLWGIGITNLIWITVLLRDNYIETSRN